MPSQLALLLHEIREERLAFSRHADALAVESDRLAAPDCTVRDLNSAALELHGWYTALEAVSPGPSTARRRLDPTPTASWHGS